MQVKLNFKAVLFQQYFPNINGFPFLLFQESVVAACLFVFNRINTMSNFSVSYKSSEEIYKIDNLFKENCHYKNVGNHCHGVSKF